MSARARSGRWPIFSATSGASTTGLPASCALDPTPPTEHWRQARPAGAGGVASSGSSRATPTLADALAAAAPTTRCGHGRRTATSASGRGAWPTSSRCTAGTRRRRSVIRDRSSASSRSTGSRKRSTSCRRASRRTRRRGNGETHPLALHRRRRRVACCGSRRTGSSSPTSTRRATSRRAAPLRICCSSYGAGSRPSDVDVFGDASLLARWQELRRRF